MFGIELAGGAAIFALFILALTATVVYSLYTRRGSGINQRPYANAYGNAPGAQGSSVLDHDRVAARQLTRGTRP